MINSHKLYFLILNLIYIYNIFEVNKTNNLIYTIKI